MKTTELWTEMGHTGSMVCWFFPLYTIYTWKGKGSTCIHPSIWTVSQNLYRMFSYQNTSRKFTCV